MRRRKEESFETHRPYLFALAYRMLGSAREAEDIVQETSRRLQATPNDAVGSLKASLTAILMRVCLDHLRLACRKREQDEGSWFPELILTTEMAEMSDPEQRVEGQESILLALLVVLEQLSPFERAVFLLYKVFAYEFARIAMILGKQEVACRPSFHQARAHLPEHRPR